MPALTLGKTQKTTHKHEAPVDGERASDEGIQGNECVRGARGVDRDCFCTSYAVPKARVRTARPSRRRV
jgi:hypothetical protein